MKYILFLMLFLVTSCNSIDDYMTYNPLVDEVTRVRHSSKCKQIIYNKLVSDGYEPSDLENEGKYQFKKDKYTDIIGTLYVTMNDRRYKIPYQVWYDHKSELYTLKWFNVWVYNGGN